ncbi:hypothetical protein BDD12DRAFT_851787, partial [Trichophaea hybrida]
MKFCTSILPPPLISGRRLKPPSRISSPLHFPPFDAAHMRASDSTSYGNNPCVVQLHVVH